MCCILFNNAKSHSQTHTCQIMATQLFLENERPIFFFYSTSCCYFHTWNIYFLSRTSSRALKYAQWVLIGALIFKRPVMWSQVSKVSWCEFGAAQPIRAQHLKLDRAPLCGLSYRTKGRKWSHTLFNRHLGCIRGGGVLPYRNLTDNLNQSRIISE